MKFMVKTISAITLSLSAVAAFAVPTHLITHNNTNDESNAFVAGVPSPYPTKAQSTGKVLWNMVRIACYGHAKDNKCSAEIKMATNTAEPVVLGTVSMDLSTGDITPKVLSAKGYTVKVNGLAETTITKD
jgi:hypothetical protein